MHLSVLDSIYQRAGMERSSAAVSVSRDGAQLEFTFEDIQRLALNLSNFLIEHGIKSGDRIAIISESNPEFGAVFFAAIRAGAILVALDPCETVDELRLQLAETEPKVIFASRAYADFASNMVNALQLNSFVVCTDASPDSVTQKTLRGVSTHILHEGSERSLDETAVIVYTAGVTGKPKGVMLTFGNLLCQADCLQQLLELKKTDTFLSTLPMSNLGELTLGYLGVLFAGGQICYVPESSVKSKLRKFAELNVSYAITTSPFLMAVTNSIQKRLSKASLQKRLQFKMRFGLAKLLPRRKRRKLFPLVNEIVGPRFRSFISAGAPLSKDVELFLDTVGLDVYHGYGLSEACFLTSINSNDKFRMHSVGKPIPEVDIRLIGAKNVGDEGEIVVRGPHVMRGYYKQESRTNVAIDSSGWLYTGDLGCFDDEGFLYVNGRISDQIHLTDGNKFYPQELEKIISQLPQVKDVCVVGVRDANSFHYREVVAVVVPESKKQKLSTVTGSIDTLLQNLPRFKKPTKIVFSDQALPRTNSGELKRQVVLSWLHSHESLTNL